MASIAEAFEMSFDDVARAVITHRIVREAPAGGPSSPDPTTALEDPDWVRSCLESGRTVSDIARWVATSEEAVTGALARLGFTVASPVGSPADTELERARLGDQFRAAVERARAAQSSLARAVAEQATAVARLASGGLTVAAIADRLDIDDADVEALLDEHAGSTPQ